MSEEFYNQEGTVKIVRGSLVDGVLKIYLQDFVDAIGLRVRINSLAGKEDLADALLQIKYHFMSIISDVTEKTKEMLDGEECDVLLDFEAMYNWLLDGAKTQEGTCFGDACLACLSMAWEFKNNKPNFSDN